MRTESTRSTSGQAWIMLLALTAAFTMSQAFRTVAAVLATPLQFEFNLTPQQLGTFAGAFHFAFGAMQQFVGIGIDLHGVRRTVLTGFPVAIAGAVVSALAPSYVMSVGGIGLLATGTPLAWLVNATSWRMGYWVLGGCSVAAWALIAWKVHEFSTELCVDRQVAWPRDLRAGTVHDHGAVGVWRDGVRLAAESVGARSENLVAGPCTCGLRAGLNEAGLHMPAKYSPAALR